MIDFVNALPQLLLSGLAMGGLYTLVAQGFYITYAGTRTFPFTLGDFLVVAVVVSATLVMGLPVRLFGLTESPILAPVIPWIVAAALAVIAAVILAIITERLTIAPLKSFEQHTWFVSTAGISLIVVNIGELTFGPQPQPITSPFGEKVLRLGPISVLPQEIFILIASFVAVGILFLFLERSNLGRALRAVAFDRNAAGLMGIDARMMAILAYVLAGVMAGIAGVLIAPITYASLYIGVDLLFKAFIAAVIGGLRSPQGILVGALILGISEKMLSYTVGLWAEPAVFIFLIAFLVIRPYGLLGIRPIEKV
jgi:branched-chain amino acid transport system permease protein